MKFVSARLTSSPSLILLLFMLLIVCLVSSSNALDINNNNNIDINNNGNNGNSNVIGNAAKLIHERLASLQRISMTSKRKDACNPHKIIKITEIPFGNSGNNLIEFTHGLWVARQLNATLLVPPWMVHILHPFDTTLIHSLFCFTETLTDSNLPTEFIEITSEDSFFLFKIFQKPGEFQERFGDKGLPELTADVMSSISKHFIAVYAALWASPKSHLLQAGLWIIQQRLQNNLRYTAAHKRSLEGHCTAMMNKCTNTSEFSPIELPMADEVWQPGNLHRSHPLCDMPGPFIRSVLTMHHRNNSEFFLAFDGQGNLDSYATWRMPILSADLPQSLQLQHGDSKFLDMFIAMHGDLFIANPLSTFSWEIFVIRVCLALESVPILVTNDFYVMHEEGFRYYHRQPTDRWVSWTSIMQAIETLMPQ